MYMCICIYTYISKCSLCSPYKVTCVNVFRADHLSPDGHLVINGEEHLSHFQTSSGFLHLSVWLKPHGLFLSTLLVCWRHPCSVHTWAVRLVPLYVCISWYCWETQSHDKLSGPLTPTIFPPLLKCSLILWFWIVNVSTGTRDLHPQILIGCGFLLLSPSVAKRICLDEGWGLHVPG